jgi:predicted LPLAT superfamily acyltransferase
MSFKPTGVSVNPRGAAAEWRTYRERGSTLTLRAMAFLSCRLGRRASRFFVYLIAAYFCLFAPTIGRNSRTYLRRALGRKPHAIDHFRHLLTFASTIHDRVYLINERFDLFDVSTDGERCVKNAFASNQGAFLMGAHVGSFEVIRSVGQQQPGLRVSMAVHEENAQKITAVLRAINPAVKAAIIGLGHLGAMLKIREHLDQGVFVGAMSPFKQ